MRVLVSGGTGFIGAPLVRALADRGDEPVVISRSGRDPWNLPGIRVVRADPSVPGDWQHEADGADGVVNLAGERIIDPKRRWTTARKRLLKESARFRHPEGCVQEITCGTRSVIYWIVPKVTDGS